MMSEIQGSSPEKDLTVKLKRFKPDFLNGLLIVTGLSGAGKSQTLKILEDIGFFCVDNLPLALIHNFFSFCQESVGSLRQVAIGMDARGLDDLTSYPMAFQSLQSQGYPLKILFLDADEKVLFSRYRESRRPHPLERKGSVTGVINYERQLLEPLRNMADYIIDTSVLSVHDLRRRLVGLFNTTDSEKLKIRIMSFSYRTGVPFEADLVFDVRFLPNPFFVSNLKDFDGRNIQVSSYILKHDVSQEFISKLCDFFKFLLPQFQWEGKKYLTIAIGCTGGKHRSVAISEYLYSYFISMGEGVELFHRELESQK